MTPTSPTSTTVAPPRPPARNKSSSALSTHTIRSLSSTTSNGKPRRNKSSSALSSHGTHHHSAGHHPVSFAHHRKNSSHGPGNHAMKRSGSATGSARKPTFGLGMTSMTSPADDGDLLDHGAGDETAVEPEHHYQHDQQQQHERPKLASRRSSSSSTVTVVAGRGRDRSRSRTREAEQQRLAQQQEEERERRLAAEAKGKAKERLSESVTSSTSGDWESSSATDSPLRIGQKLPDVERVQPVGHSGLAQAFDERGQAPVPPAARQNGGKKAKFQLGAEDEDGEDEDDEEDEDGVEEAAIPPAAMPPAETPILPAMPAVIQALAPADSAGAEEVKEELKPEPEAAAEAGSAAVPPPVASPQHLSPPDDPATDRSPGSGANGKSEPSLAAAAQPEFAYPNKPPSPPLSRPPSEDAAKPLSRPQSKPSLHPNPAQTDVNEPRAPLRPTPQHPHSNSHPHSFSSRPHPPHPTRKASDASIMSRASMRSHLTASRAPPAFRRTASGAAPVVVDRAAMARAELASPGPSDLDSEEAQRRSVVGDRPGVRRAQTGGAGHSRAESANSMRSLRQAAEATTAPGRRANTLGPADARRLKPTETAGGALAALGNIAALSNVRSPPPNRDEDEGGGALTHAKRSASGYFNALRGLTSFPALGSTPPLSPSASASGRYPAGGPNSRDRTSSTFSKGGSRTRASPTMQQPPLVVKFADPPPPPPPASQPAPSTSPSASTALLSSSPSTHSRLTAQNRSASSASLSNHGPLSRTQQKALLARDAPAVKSPAPAAGTVGAAQNGMQKWALGLIKEAERIERQYRAVERWRDPMGESLERVLGVASPGGKAVGRDGRRRETFPPLTGEGAPPVRAKAQRALTSA
ncbi:hypothetical protein JCM8097_009046 [Rhodosporidiobolus ruineniae]